MEIEKEGCLQQQCDRFKKELKRHEATQGVLEKSIELAQLLMAEVHGLDMQLVAAFKNDPRSVKVAGGSVRGDLSSTRGGYRIELFISAECDASGHGEGSELVGAVDVLIPNLPGQQTVSFTAPVQATGSELAGWISATATDSSGNTSRPRTSAPSALPEGTTSMVAAVAMSTPPRIRTPAIGAGT